MPNTEPCEAEKALNADLVKFRELMGDLRFWAKPDTVELAKKGITVQYLGGTFVNLQRVTYNYMATMQEFTRRAIMLRHKI